jgi:transcription elongation factor GreA
MQSPITREGYEKLKSDLEFLRNNKRPKILAAIEEARAHGDISENAEYEAAKEEYQFMQKKIGEIEEMLTTSVIVEVKKSVNGIIEFGNKVQLKNLDTDEEAVYMIVGPYESDIQKGTISISSPLGRALLGKNVGDEVTFKAPGGERTYEIITIA